jgi:hypothetical protein
LYTTPGFEFYGNGTQSYLEAYSNRIGNNGGKPKVKIGYLTAQVNAYKLLRKPEVIERINELLEAKGFSDENVDKQHLFLLNQFADLKTKLGAIAEYNKLKKRVDTSPKTLIMAGNQISFGEFKSNS